MDKVILTGDTVKFEVDLTPAELIAPAQIAISGTGTMTVGGMAVCLEPDISSVVLNMGYKTKQHTIPGSGTLTIKVLQDDQLSQVTTHMGEKLLLVGSQFDAEFLVGSPAQQPVPGSSPVPDAPPGKTYMGKGSFETSNEKFSVS